jgi:broad specificity phosphatase PhoE
MDARALKSHPLRPAEGGRRKARPRRLLPLLLLTALFAARAAALAALDTVWLVRHAEKADPWPAERELDAFWPLSPEGAARAQRLATRLKDAGIAAVYSSRTTRSVETAVPLAHAAGLRIFADDASIKPDQMAGFFEGLRERHAKDGAVLVVGHSNTIPNLLIKLGATPDCYARLGIKEGTSGLEAEGYDGLWRVDLKKQGCAAIERQ